jgi:type I restriction enzyme S subunit
MGQSPPGDTYNSFGDGLPFFQGRTDFGFRFPTQRVFCNAPTRLAEIGDILVSVRAPVGDVNMALEKCCIGRGVAGVRHPFGYRSFVFYSLRELRSKFDQFDSEGTVFGSINKKDFQALHVIKPSQELLKVFDENIAPLDSKIVVNEIQLRTLTSIRDTLLTRLISGQLRLPDAEALIEETTA